MEELQRPVRTPQSSTAAPKSAALLPLKLNSGVRLELLVEKTSLPPKKTTTIRQEKPDV